uniref:Uncharacterized protein n=1 Tax=Xiphophorus maculatus TaxID=8083 RepID=A0A3B5PWI5_XIPMA
MTSNKPTVQCLRQLCKTSEIGFLIKECCDLWRQTKAFDLIHHLIQQSLIHQGLLMFLTRIFVLIIRCEACLGLGKKY